MAGVAAEEKVRVVLVGRSWAGKISLISTLLDIEVSSPLGYTGITTKAIIR